MASLSDYINRFLVNVPLLPTSLLPDEVVKRRYVKAGADYADSLSYTLHGADPIQQKEFMFKHDYWERELIRRGFNPVSIDQLYESGANDTKFEEVVKGIKKSKR